MWTLVIMRRSLGRNYYLSQIIMESSLIVVLGLAAAGVWKCLGRVKCTVGEHRGGGDRQLDISINLNMLERGGTLRARDHQHPQQIQGVLVVFIPAQCPQLQ